MAYETSGSSNVNDLVDKLRIFAVAQGWAVDFTGASGVGSGVALLIHKAGLYFGIYSDSSVGDAGDPGPRIFTFTYQSPYSSGLGPTGQASQSNHTRTNKMAGPFQAYHFFAGDTYLHVVVEVAPGSFRHFGIGQLEQAGAVTDAAYAYGSFWNHGSDDVGNALSGRHALPFDDLGTEVPNYATAVRADSDAIFPRFLKVMDNAGSGGSGWGGFRRTGNLTHEDAPIAGLMRIGPSTLTGRSILLPLFCAVHRPSGNLSIVGAPRDMRAIRMDNLSAGELITIGPDSWKVFPAIRKNGIAGQETSLNFAYAYRVIS